MLPYCRLLQIWVLHLGQVLNWTSWSDGRFSLPKNISSLLQTRHLFGHFLRRDQCKDIHTLIFSYKVAHMVDGHTFHSIDDYILSVHTSICTALCKEHMVHNTFAGTYCGHSSCCMLPCREGRLECMGNCTDDCKAECVHILTGNEYVDGPFDKAHTDRKVMPQSPTLHCTVCYT